MSTIDELRKQIDTTPFYALAGVTDLAVEKVRHAQLRAETVRAELAPTKVAEKALDLPALALNQTLVVGGKVSEGYEAFAVRGKDVVKRIRNQKATKELVEQVDTTVAQAKGAVTTARKAAADIERSAKATITTGRKEAVKVANVLTDVVTEDAKVAQEEIKASAKRTKTAAKRTRTTAKKATKRTTTATKAATTSARKTTRATTKATEAGAEKVGD